MNTDELIDAVSVVVAGYKSKTDTALDDIGRVLDDMNGDTVLVEAEKIANEINGENV